MGGKVLVGVGASLQTLAQVDFLLAAAEVVVHEVHDPAG